MRGFSYSRLIDGLNKAGIKLNRKQLSEIAIHDPVAFDKLVEEAKNAREAAAVA
jgi:large subunit ribosomal protein L20